MSYEEFEEMMNEMFFEEMMNEMFRDLSEEEIKQTQNWTKKPVRLEWTTQVMYTDSVGVIEINLN
jgi:hypothetical protein